MGIFEGKTASERNKIIAAIVLGVLAAISLGYMFLGSSSSSSTPPRRIAAASPSPTPKIGEPPIPQDDSSLTPIPRWVQTGYAAEADRNIFAYYVPPPPPVRTPSPPPPPTPPPPPPLLLGSINPTNVYARTGDFTLEVTGDKFTPSCQISFEGRDLQTRYFNAQRLSATVSATLIGSDGSKKIKIHTPDNVLYSNEATLNLMAPPVPNYNYIGALIGHTDTVLLQEKNSKEVESKQRGEIVGGRFRVTSVSAREVWLVDTTLNIKHVLAYNGSPTGEGSGRGQQPVRPKPADSEDDDN
jgi:hypothetical protein